jgi:carboxyl-terminal processing protease
VNLVPRWRVSIESKFTCQKINPRGMKHEVRGSVTSREGEVIMRPPRLVTPVLAAGLLGSFAVGLSFPEVLAGAQQYRIAGGLPERYLRPRSPGGGGSGIEPLNSYYRTLGTLKERYYGPLPSDVKLTYSAVRGLLRPLDDPYTRFLDPASYRQMLEENQGGYIGLGALMAPKPTRDGYPRIHKVMRGTLAYRAGLKPLDVILAVNGASTRSKSLEVVWNMLRGRVGTPVRLTMRRTGRRPFAVRILRQPVEFEIVESRMLEGKVGLVFMSEFNERSDGQVDRALTKLEQQGMRALILDLRGNRGGTLDAAHEVASRFLPRGKDVVVIVEKTGEPEVRKVLESKHNHRFNRPGRMIPLVVLVNRTSASAAEIVSGAIKDHRTGTILGTPTYGKGLVQTVVPLRGGAAIAITSARYLTPSGQDINRKQGQRGGITPDVVVEATEQDWVRHNDVQLRRALTLLHQRIGYRRPVRVTAQAGRRA